MGRNLKLRALCGGAIVALVQAAAASAQTTPPTQSVDEVVVTGSRVITNGFAAPTPLTVVTQEQMKLTAPNSLSDAINQLPQFKSSFVSASSGFRNGAGDGGNFINLRGLGAKRGLVLLDGERVVQSQASNSVAGAVDLNVLPQSLVKRVDVVTGGATAAYGSDALTGVVNFVLDTKFTGLKGEIRGGLTTYNDDHNGDISLAYGRSFAGDRLHVIASAEHFRTDGVVDFTDRPWDNNATATISTGAVLPQTSTAFPTTDSTGKIVGATNIVSANIRRATQTSGGLVTAGAAALKDKTFLTSAGTLTAFPFGQFHTAGGATMVGGGFDPDFGRYFSLMPSNTRDNGYFRVTYDLAPDWSAHADVLYGSSTVHYRGLYQSGSYTIFADNAFLTPAEKALASGPGATSAKLFNPATGQFTGPTTNTFTVGRINTDWGFEEEHSYFTMMRESVGLDGKIGLWNVSAYYTHGESAHKDTSPGEANNLRLYDALDAVASPGTAGLPAAGTPICRSTITNSTNGCVPLNILGQNVATPQALAWIQAGGGPMLSQHLIQDVVDFSVRGEPFSLWAGPVSLGAGATYRKEQGHAAADAISEAYNPAIVSPLSPLYKPGLTPGLSINGYPTALQGARGDWSGFNPGGSKGAFDVKEVFAETLVPLAKDQFLAQALNFNGAIRYADYSTAGGQTNWKVGLIYQPVEDIKFRGTMSRDIRAPNLFDLFGGVTQSNGQFLDAFTNNSTVGAVTVSQGNRALKPEVGDTTTLGVVLQPRAIPGLSLSMDHYLIIISNAIASPGGATITSQCKLGNASFCSLFVRDPVTGLLTILHNDQQNIGTTKQSGLDIEASYRLPLSRVFANRDDVLSFRVLANYMDKNSTFILGSTSVTNAVGINGGGIVGGTGGNVDWQGSLNVNYARGPLTINWQERFINGGKIVATADSAGNPYLNTSVNPSATGAGQVPNTIPAFFYTDLSATYKFGKDRQYEAFITVANLFNKAPPTDLGSAAFGVGILPTNYTLYDTLGRNYTMGVRFKF